MLGKTLGVHHVRAALRLRKPMTLPPSTDYLNYTTSLDHLRSKEAEVKQLRRALILPSPESISFLKSTLGFLHKRLISLLIANDDQSAEFCNCIR